MCGILGYLGTREAVPPILDGPKRLEYRGYDSAGLAVVGDDCKLERERGYDLHATILHLLGFDHKKLTCRFGGGDVSLTDVHGKVVSGILSSA